MSEKPIRLTVDEVRALLHGRKTMIRSPVKTPPPDKWDSCDAIQSNGRIIGWRFFKSDDGIDCGYIKRKLIPCFPGDILWVKETWDDTLYDRIIYRTDYVSWKAFTEEYPKGRPDKWKPSVHMPREAARLFLTVADVRFERLQDITEEDARAEGMRSYALDRAEKWCQYTAMAAKSQSRERPRVVDEVGAVALFWDAKYGKKYSWKSNPWVFVIDFEVVIKHENMQHL